MERDYSIDLLKCLAALLITWSHLDPLLGKYAMFATGGSFGDCLFFFCSGYTLFLSQKKMSFFNWYKRRINRIYPTVFAWALVCACFFHSNRNMAEIVISGGGFFVSCIMIFYLLFYPSKKYIITDAITIQSCRYICFFVGGILTVSYIALFFFVNVNDSDMMYRWIWSLYFIPMFMGGVLGKIQFDQRGNGLNYSVWKICVGLSMSVVGYYILTYITKMDYFLFLKPLVILPQLGVTLFFYLLCRTIYAERLYNNKFSYVFIRIIGGLCLEIYIVQSIIIREFAMMKYFPLKILIVFIMVVFFAYVLKCIGQVWRQTFKDSDYDWKEILNPW